MAAQLTSDVSKTENETNTDGRQKAELTEAVVDASTGEVQTKIRYVHLNDRVYCVGGRRTDNPLQWYTIDTWSRASEDGPITDDISIYQIEEDRQTAKDVCQIRSDRSAQTQANVYTIDRTSDDEQFQESEVVNNGVKDGDVADWANEGSAAEGEEIADDAISSPQTSVQIWRPPSSDMKDKQKFEVAMSQFRDSYEQQLAAYK